MYHLPCVCRTLVLEICLHPEMHELWYIDVVHMHDEQPPSLLKQGVIRCLL